MSLDNALAKLERFVGNTGLICSLVLLPLLIGVRCWEVFSRNVSNAPASLFNAMEGELFLLFAFLTIGSAYVSDSHVRVDILRDRWSERTKALVEIAGALLCVLPFTWIILWYGSDLVVSAWSHGERAAIGFGAPIKWVLIAALPVGVGLFAVAVLARMLRNILFLTGRQSQPDITL